MVELTRLAAGTGVFAAMDLQIRLIRFLSTEHIDPGINIDSAMYSALNGASSAVASVIEQQQLRAEDERDSERAD